MNEEVVHAATQCLNSTLMGTDAITDYLALTLYAGNIDHRTVSESPMELQDTYVRLDNAWHNSLSRLNIKWDVATHCLY